MITNYERYKYELIDAMVEARMCEFIREYVLQNDDCLTVDCDICRNFFKSWLNAKQNNVNVICQRCKYFKEVHSNPLFRIYCENDNQIYRYVTSCNQFEEK